MVIIQRGGLGDIKADPKAALESCLRTARTLPTPALPEDRGASCTAADGMGLREKEREIIRQAMESRPTTIIAARRWTGTCGCRT